MTNAGEAATAGVGIVAVCAAAGWMYTGGTTGAVVGGIVGLAVAAVSGWMRVRAVAAIAVVAAAALGAVVGRSLVRVLCLPSECTGLEIVGAVVTAIGAFVGVGLVVALVLRSFDEFRSSGEPPGREGSA